MTVLSLFDTANNFDIILFGSVTTAFIFFSLQTLTIFHFRNNILSLIVFKLEGKI